MQRLSARCMRTLLHFRMRAHSFLNVLGWRNGVPRAQHLCQRCNLHALQDDRHLVIECPCHACVRDRYTASFSPANNTMQLRHSVTWWGVAHYIMMCLVPLMMMLLMMHHPDLQQPWRWTDVLHSYTHISYSAACQYISYRSGNYASLFLSNIVGHHSLLTVVLALALRLMTNSLLCGLTCFRASLPASDCDDPLHV